MRLASCSPSGITHPGHIPNIGIVDGANVCMLSREHHHRYGQEVTDGVVSRPGGRSARVGADVHRATLELLSERSWSEITMSDIAERADVHPATVYRRWGTIDGLIVDVVSELWERLNPVPDTGSLEKDLELWATRAVRGVSGAFGLLRIRALLMIRSEQAADGLPPAMLKRLADIRHMLERAAARGESPPSVDHVLEGILAPMYFRLLFGTGETPRPTPACSANVSCGSHPQSWTRVATGP